MTAIGVTKQGAFLFAGEPARDPGWVGSFDSFDPLRSPRRASRSHNRSTESHDWKRWLERPVRSSGLPYTKGRPGWFEQQQIKQPQSVFLQGDTRDAGNSSDGVIARCQIA